MVMRTYYGSATYGHVHNGRVEARPGSGTDAGVIGFVDDPAAVAQGAQVTFTVARTVGTGGIASVGYATVDGTALAGIDYTATSGTLTWADGEGGSKTFVVQTTVATGSAVDVTFTAGLSDVVGATLGDAEATGTILGEVVEACMIEDTFTGLAGVRLLDHTPDTGGAWLNLYDILNVDPNAFAWELTGSGGALPIHNASSYYDEAYFIDQLVTTGATVRLTFTINPASAGTYFQIGLITRAQEVSTGVWDFLLVDTFFQEGNGTVTARQYSEGAGGDQAATLSMSAGSHELRAELPSSFNPVVTVYYDDVQILQAPVHVLIPTAGYVGFSIRNATGDPDWVVIDGFCADEIVPVPAWTLHGQERWDQPGYAPGPEMEFTYSGTQSWTMLATNAVSSMGTYVFDVEVIATNEMNSPNVGEISQITITNPVADIVNASTMDSPAAWLFWLAAGATDASVTINVTAINGVPPDEPLQLLVHVVQAP